MTDTLAASRVEPRRTPRVGLGVLSQWEGEVDAFRARVRLAADLGYEAFAVGDVPFASRELYTTLAVAASTEPRLSVGPMVATPFLRHPVVDVGAMASLQELTGGRAVYTLGCGGGVPLGLGVRPATAAHAADYLQTMRTLMQGEPAGWDGQQVSPMRSARPFPLYFSARGPRALRVAGEVADGVVLSVAASQHALDRAERAVRVVREAALTARRDPDAIDIWAFAVIAVRDTREAALADISSHLATTALVRLRPKHMLESVPAEFRQAILSAQQRYDVSEHVVVGSDNAQLVAELGLADFLAGYSALAGTPAEVRQAVDHLAQLGVTRIVGALAGNADQEGTLRRFADALA